MNLLLEHIGLFKRFLDKDILPATEELERISQEGSRKHLQKLVYTNLVDRFDFFLDKYLLDCVSSSDGLIEELLEKHKDPISESEILKLMLSSTSPREVALSKLKDTLRSSTLRGRHSTKLFKLLKLSGFSDNDSRRNRVNPSTGKVFSTYKVQNKKIPASVVGYADWLYCRRNTIIHGGGKLSLLDNDYKFLKNNFNVVPAKSINLRLTSITTAKAFYSDLIAQIESHITNENKAKPAEERS